MILRIELRRRMTSVLLWIVLISVGVPLSIMDIISRRLPNVLTSALFVLGAIIISISGIVDHASSRVISRNGGCQTFCWHWSNRGLLWHANTILKYLFEFHTWSPRWSCLATPPQGKSKDNSSLWSIYDNRPISCNVGRSVIESFSLLTTSVTLIKPRVS